MALVVHVGDLDEAVRVAGHQRPARPGARAGQRPRVRPAGQVDQRRQGRAHLLERRRVRPGGRAERAGRHDERDVRAGAALEAGHGRGAEQRGEPAAPQLGLPAGERHVPDQEHGAAVPRLPRIGGDPGEAQIGRQGRARAEPRVDAGRVRVEHGAARRVEMLVLPPGRAAQVGSAGEDVEAEAGSPDYLGPSAVGATPVVLELAQPILGLHEPLGEERVVGAGGPRGAGSRTGRGGRPPRRPGQAPRRRCRASSRR